MYCKYCGGEIHNDSVFCPKCGKNQKDEVNNAISKEAPETTNVIKIDSENNMQQSTSRIDEDRNPKIIKRTTEFVLGLIGGILGLISSIIVIFLGGLADALSSSGSGLGNLGFAAFLFSVVGIVGAVMVHKKGKLGGLLMLIAAIFGVISVFVGYLVAGVLLLIGGIISIRKPDQNPTKVKWIIWIPVGLVISILIFVISLTSTGESIDSSSTSDLEYSMGDEVEVGNIEYIVNEVSTAKILSDDYFEYTTQGVFLSVNVTIENLGKESVTIDSTMFNIVEPDGTAYEPSIDLNSSDLFLDSLNPKTSRDYNIVFDLPTESAEYMLQVSDGMFGMKTANIKLDYTSSFISPTSTPLPTMTVEINSDTVEENSDMVSTDNPISDVDTNLNAETEGEEAGSLTSDIENDENDSGSPVFYKTVTAFIENVYNYEDGYMLEWVDEEGYYRYGYLPQKDIDYSFQTVDMETENSGKMFTKGSDNINYSDITSIQIVTVKSDEYYEEDLTSEDVYTLLEEEYPGYNIYDTPENDFGSEMGFWYFFTLSDGISPAFDVYVKDDTGEVYSAYLNDFGRYEPGEILE